MTIRVVPVQLNIDDMKTNTDAGGVHTYQERRSDAAIAADFQEQLNASVGPGAQLITLLPTSKSMLKYLAIYQMLPGFHEVEVTTEQVWTNCGREESDGS